MHFAESMWPTGWVHKKVPIFNCSHCHHPFMLLATVCLPAACLPASNMPFSFSSLAEPICCATGTGQKISANEFFIARLAQLPYWVNWILAEWPIGEPYTYTFLKELDGHRGPAKTLDTLPSDLKLWRGHDPFFTRCSTALPFSKQYMGQWPHSPITQVTLQAALAGWAKQEHSGSV